MKRKIHITESQLKEIVKMMNEGSQSVNLNGSNFNGLPLTQCVDVAQNLSKQVPNAKVTLCGQEILPNSSKQDIENGLKNTGKEISQGQLEEAKLDGMSDDDLEMAASQARTRIELEKICRMMQDEERSNRVYYTYAPKLGAVCESKSNRVVGVFTKRKINEARLNKLVKESVKVVKKKNLK